uniref:Uncharacterized protein n=1 Tax=Anopheles braziliensis TaxID=58242 RepID=A0A2M3ZJ50_9DIPT
MSKRWGALKNGDAERKKEVPSNGILLPISKMVHFQQIKLPYTITKAKRLPLKNSLVTQTVEVMKQTEMIQTLIDTYSTKSGCGYILNPCQLMPTVHFPASNVADLTRNERVTRPFWFVPYTSTPFTRGEPKNHVQLSRAVVLQALRKAACGLLCMVGFSEINESALTMFVDGLDQHMALLVHSLRSVMGSSVDERNPTPDALLLERMHLWLERTSLCNLHNYEKQITSKNRYEVREFRDISEEYERLLQENQLTVQSMQQKLGEIREEEYLNFIDSQQPHSSNGGGTIMEGTALSIVNFINGESANGFKEILDGELLESNSAQEPKDKVYQQQQVYQGQHFAPT